MVAGSRRVGQAAQTVADKGVPVGRSTPAVQGVPCTTGMLVQEACHAVLPVWPAKHGFEQCQKASPSQPDAAVEQLEHNAGPLVHAAGGQHDVHGALPHHTRHGAIFGQQRT